MNKLINKIINDLKNTKNINDDPLRYILNNGLLNDSGLILEFGTWKGQTVDMISDFTDKIVYGFDSFEGIDYQWGELDMNKFKLDKIPTKVNKLDKNKKCNTGVISEFNKNVCFINGFFEDSLPKFLEENRRKITFLHVDCDIYESTKTIFDHCGNLISNDCIIIFDELINYPNFESHEIKAFYEWVSKNDIEFEWLVTGSDVYDIDEIKFIDSLDINLDLVNSNKFRRMNDSRSEILYKDKRGLFNINVEVALKITKNPSFIL